MGRQGHVMILIGLDGHHNGQGGNLGARWLTENKAKFFAKTALMINDGHPSTIATRRGGAITPATKSPGPTRTCRWSGTPAANSGPSFRRSRGRRSRNLAFRSNSTRVRPQPASDLGSFLRYLPSIDSSEYDNYFHTDWETPKTVPWTGLEASTGAFARATRRSGRSGVSCVFGLTLPMHGVSHKLNQAYRKRFQHRLHSNRYPRTNDYLPHGTGF